MAGVAPSVKAQKLPTPIFSNVCKAYPNSYRARSCRYHRANLRILLAVVGVAVMFLASSPIQIVTAHDQSPAVGGSLAHHVARETPSVTANASCNSVQPVGLSPQLLPAICVGPQVLCQPGSTTCGSYPSTTRAHLWVNSTGNTTITPWVQVVFVLETTPYDGVYDPSVGDTGGNGPGNNPADPCAGPCAESLGVPYFVNNVAKISHGITMKNIGVANSPHVTFSLVDYFSNYDPTSTSTDSHDDGDGSEYNVDVSTFEQATTFATTVTAMATSNPSTLFGGGCPNNGWNYSTHVYCDSDFSDNFLQTSMITAIYGGLHGSGLGWINNSTTYHVVVWMGSSLPRDPSHSGDWCVTYNDYASKTCPDATSTSEPAYTYGSGIVEPAGETLASIAKIAKQEHVIIDSIDLPDGLTELTPPNPVVAGDTDYIESTSAEITDAKQDITNMLSAGCYLATATGGNWEGPSPTSTGVGFTCSAAATGNNDGNLTDTWCAYSSTAGCWPGWNKDTSLGWALTNINFPPTKILFNVTGWMKEGSFTFSPYTGFTMDTTWMTYYCLHNGVDVSSQCKSAISHPLGAGYAWDWPYGTMNPDDVWSVSFNVTVNSNYPSNQQNNSVPVDNCLTANWTGCPGAGGIPYTQVFYMNYTSYNYTQPFPPAYVKVMASPNVPVLSSVSLSPSSTNVFVGHTQAFTVTPSCTGGPCPAGTTYSWVLTNNLGTLSSYTGSSVTFTAASTSGSLGIFVNGTLNSLTIQSSPDIITVFTLASVSVNPVSAALTSGGQQAFTATPTCTIACPAGVTFSWTLTNGLGSLNSSTGATVTFTAGSSGGNVSLFVNATLLSVTRQSSAVPISIALIILTSVSVSPASVNIATGASAPFTAYSFCAAGPCPLGTTYSWTLTNGLGSLSSSSGPMVTFTAGPTNGTDILFVNGTLNGIRQQSTPAYIFIAPNSVQLVAVSITPSSGNVVTGGSTAFVATVVCSGGTCPSGTTFSWTLTNSLGNLSSRTGASVTFTAGVAAGTVNLFVNASLNGTTRMSSPVPITIGTPAIVLSSVSVIPISANLNTGATQNFVATPGCTGGACPSGTLYAWTLTRSLGTLSSSNGSSITFTAGSVAGMFALFVNATLNGVTKQSPAVIITIGTAYTLSAVSVSPSSATLNSSSSQAFTSVPTCFGGSCPAGITYSWALTNSLATLNSSVGPTVLVTAGMPGGIVLLFVNATLHGATVQSVPATITIFVPSLNSVSITPSTANLETGNKQVFTATPSCNDGPCPSGTTYVWSLSNTATGSLNAYSGSQVTFTAGGLPGTVNLYVSATLNGNTKDSSAVPITVTSPTATLLSVSVSPASDSILTSGEQSFTATPQCTGGACPSGTTYLWTIARSGMGTVSSTTTATVVFTAGTAAGSVSLWVNATLNGVKADGFAMITITALSTAPTLSTVTVTANPSSTTLNQGDTRILLATPSCSGGACPSGITYSWSVTSALGSLSSSTESSVTFTAGEAAGTVTIFVNATLNGVTVRSEPTTFVISSSTPASSGAGIDYLWTVVAIASLVAVSLVVMILLERRRKKDAGMQAVSPNYEDLSAGNHLEPPSQG